MKKILFLSSIVLASLVTSCQDEFLDSAPTETVGDAPAQTKLNGLYVMMINTGTGGTNLDHDDFGQKGYDIYSDMLSQDMVLEGVTYGWYSRLANMSAQVDFTRTENYKPWRYYYRIIAGANDVIDDLGGTDAVPTSDTDKYAMGQAKAMRAYAYFYLLQFFTKGYNPTEAAIPVYTKSQQPAAPKSTQAQVYALIIDDLTKSINYLNGFNRLNKGMIDQGVAKGLLAYTYAAMGQYTQAATLSKEVINSYGYSITSKVQAIRMIHSGTTASGGGFNDLSTPSWMWGYNLDVVNGLDLVSWWGQVDVFTYSYAGAGDRKGIDLGLYNSMRTDDARRNQFVVTTPARNYPGNKFFDPGRVSMGQRQITTDYIFMRVDEFYLLAAESLAKSGQETEAKTILKNYLQNRITDVSYIDALSGTALQNEIYKNTRLEFWGEGKSYLALKRNKATVTRGSNHLFLAGQSFSYDDERMYLKIPQEEILNNPNF
ncbi:RagB/SusD family nutrient uptake outer membrane protein [uncultured Chryseobacterium sp.]|uniref:RagB/SusD family nutrient uptake outer membrane protein n=1 Tax=uncultured Chryseobacterium sp. TaxID=259322 RepID=UPI0027DC927F|nr:RagB/SusD family nutrient uptake outer membrane protein [uncultured Chryseobacterium sp.]